jgi:hypothetical protein
VNDKIELYQQPGNITKYESIQDMRFKLEGYEKMVDKDPVGAVKKGDKNNKLDFAYIPIDILEEEITKYTFGLWNWVIDGDPIIVANEIIVRGTLEIFHPVVGIWLKRSGIGAAQIRYQAEYETVNGKSVKTKTDITDISKKITTALQMDAPHAAAEAFKNAASKYGRIFGRGLRRDITQDYKGFGIKESVNPDIKQALDKILILLDESTLPNKEAIRQECVKANKDGQFTIEFADSVAKKLGGTL